MSDTVIKVENLGKLYRYGQSGFSRHSLREALTDAARSTVHSARSLATWPLRRFGTGVRSQVSGANLQSGCPPERAISNLQSEGPSPRPSRSPRFKPLPVALPNLQSEI